ncbi:alpha-aminoadipic semialdehyde synthase isoform X2 [Nymphaea colorata]|uniref:alpha-aminoadipic semialdehyde synthase isoform X2 n=1 Tax=Nymphaea colorata TaxID=210225 RepID=UPI00214ED16F|nr:alpha-aminoadipic semialdehyde synthase isoform X2 [Nymphaea colorata]
MNGNGVVGILSESCNIWERRAPLTPSHCARLLCGGTTRSGASRIIVQPCTKRIYHDSQYEDIGCEISDDLSECGLILGVKQPKLEMILPDRAYAFFSHTHKAQKENMPLLDKILTERVTLFDYELIVGENGKRLLAFGKYAGRAGMIDFLSGLGKRYLNLGYSTPFLSLGASYTYPTLSAAKAAIIAVGEEIATFGLPSAVTPIVFVFTGSGNVSQGAQEIFNLLPHSYVDPCQLPEVVEMDKKTRLHASRGSFQLYGCVVTCKDIVAPKDTSKSFNKVDYYSHPDNYNPIFHETIAPYASVIVNCMYWEKRFPRLLTTEQFQDLMQQGSPLVGVCDITCDISGSLEFINQTTTIEKPFFRYNPFTDSYHDDMKGIGIICQSVDILPTEFAREATQHFGDVLSQFVGSLSSTNDISSLPPHLRRACISHHGVLTSLYEYIPRMRNSDSLNISQNISYKQFGKKKYATMVSLTGHLFDKFLINEALDVIEAAGGSFHLVRCEVGQSVDAMSYSELEVSADDGDLLNQIIDSLSSLACKRHDSREVRSIFSLKVGKVDANSAVKDHTGNRSAVLILGAGRVCQPAAAFLSSSGTSETTCDVSFVSEVEGLRRIHVIVASVHLSDAQKAVEDIPNAEAAALDVMDKEELYKYISKVEVVISLLPPSFHFVVANACIELKKHLVTASYVSDSISQLDGAAKSAGITILCEMGLDPGIGDELYDFATTIRFPHLPAFALEYIPNRDSLVYGRLYGIIDEASTILRGTLRYEGFSKIMSSLAKIGLFDTETHPLLKEELKPTFQEFLGYLLKFSMKEDLQKPADSVVLALEESQMVERLTMLGHCKEKTEAEKTVKTIKFLGLDEASEIPKSCQSPFDVVCMQMEKRLTYTETEQDMVLLHHEMEIQFPDSRSCKTHQATLLELGKMEKGKMSAAMARTVGIPAAIGALLLLEEKIKTRGVLRPVEPEVYIPALDILGELGIKLIEKVELS